MPLATRGATTAFLGGLLFAIASQRMERGQGLRTASIHASAFQVATPFALRAGTVSGFRNGAGPFPSTNTHLRTTTSSSSTTALLGKVWDKLEIDEDPKGEHFWYMLNCVAGGELELLAQLKKTQSTMNQDDVLKFVVPQERKLRSHGTRNVVDVKALYPGYVFAHLRLCAEVYETIQQIPLCRSWMGTVHMKGMKRLPVIPVVLNDDEIEKFKLLEEQTDAIFAKYGEDYDGYGDEGEDLLEQYAGYEVDGMVKVLTGKHKGEDAVIKRLKDGKVKVRLFTYGTSFDEWYDVAEIRPMSDAEVMRGLTGPDKPIRQDEFEISIGRKPRDRGRRGAVADSKEGSLRGNLYSSLGGGRGRQRNTRQGRQQRGERGRGDRFGRTKEELDEEERNWRQYREQQRSERKEGAWDLQGEKPWMYEDTQDVTAGDDESGGRFQRGGDIISGRQQRRMRRQTGEQDAYGAPRKNTEGVERALDGEDDWLSFAQEDEKSGEKSIGTSSDTDFFDSLMSELSDTLESPERASPTSSISSKPNDRKDDDFFSSLMNDLADDSTSDDRRSGGGNSAPSGGQSDDDFFASLEQDLSESLNGLDGSGADKVDENFFATLEEDISAAVSASGGDEGSSSTDFFNEVSIDIAGSVSTSDPRTSGEASSAGGKYGGGTPSLSVSLHQQDLQKLTVPVLKGMLKEKGLKVGGKKAELIERLQSS